MLNRSLLKYDKFINMLKGGFDNGQKVRETNNSDKLTFTYRRAVARPRNKY